MRIDHANQRIQLVDVHLNGSVKSVAGDRGTKQHAMHQVQFV